MCLTRPAPLAPSMLPPKIIIAKSSLPRSPNKDFKVYGVYAPQVSKAWEVYAVSSSVHGNEIT